MSLSRGMEEPAGADPTHPAWMREFIRILKQKAPLVVMPAARVPKPLGIIAVSSTTRNKTAWNDTSVSPLTPTYIEGQQVPDSDGEQRFQVEQRGSSYSGRQGRQGGAQ